MVETRFQELFINEAKAALDANSPLTDDQVSDIVTTYLAENSIEPESAVIEDGILKIT